MLVLALLLVCSWCWSDAFIIKQPCRMNTFIKPYRAAVSSDDNCKEVTSILQQRAGDGRTSTNTTRRVIKLIDKLSDSMNDPDITKAVWETIRYEAAATADGDLKVATLMANAILSQPSLEEAIIDYIANQIATPSLQATQLRNLFTEVITNEPHVKSLWAFDIMSAATRDVSQPNAISVLLFNQGFMALATYRIAHSLWRSGRDGIARYLQSVVSRTFGSDIHPACKIGAGCYLDTGSGVVIGETAVVGDNCCISHGVTLGGTGKESGDRHPKVGKGVYISAGATVLGNIQIGEGSIINAGSVVTKPVAPFTRVGGVPAKFISSFEFNEYILAELSQEKYIETTEASDAPQSIVDYHGEPE